MPLCLSGNVSGSAKPPIFNDSMKLNMSVTSRFTEDIMGRKGVWYTFRCDTYLTLWTWLYTSHGFHLY